MAWVETNRKRHCNMILKCNDSICFCSVTEFKIYKHKHTFELLKKIRELHNVVHIANHVACQKKQLKLFPITSFFWFIPDAYVAQNATIIIHWLFMFLFFVKHITVNEVPLKCIINWARKFLDVKKLWSNLRHRAHISPLVCILIDFN